MKVYVSQGHEKGIGLEVFFKSVLLLSNEERESIVFLAYQKSVEETLKSLKLAYSFSPDSVNISGVNLKAQWLKTVNHSESFTSLSEAMTASEKKGVLYTLPTSKDQFPGFAGHTEYFRHHYKKPELGMFFSSPKLQVLLISDHVAIKDLSTTLSTKVIRDRLTTALSTLESWRWPTEHILISGLNPHAGENGLIGLEDSRIKDVVQDLKHRFSISGPWPGDTMLMEQRSPQDLLVYLFHDQGLGVFKSLQGFIGSNITLGLPFPRFSPDHGTSFSLYGKNQADYRGCSFSLKQAIKLLKDLQHGKNSSH